MDVTEVSFGAVFTIVVAVALIILIFVLVWAAVKLFPGKKYPRLGKNTLRRGVILTGEILAVCQIFALTYVGATAAAGWGAALASFAPAKFPPAFVTSATIAGGIAGFLLGVSWTVLLFAVAAIERNTRYSAKILEMMAYRNQDER